MMNAVVLFRVWFNRFWLGRLASTLILLAAAFSFGFPAENAWAQQ